MMIRVLLEPGYCCSDCKCKFTKFLVVKLQTHSCPICHGQLRAVKKKDWSVGFDVGVVILLPSQYSGGMRAEDCRDPSYVRRPVYRGAARCVR